MPWVWLRYIVCDGIPPSDASVCHPQPPFPTLSPRQARTHVCCTHVGPLFYYTSHRSVAHGLRVRAASTVIVAVNQVDMSS